MKFNKKFYFNDNQFMKFNSRVLEVSIMYHYVEESMCSTLKFFAITLSLKMYIKFDVQL